MPVRKGRAVSIECVCQATVKAPPQECYAVVADAARWPEWAREVERVEVDPAGTDAAVRVRVVVEILGEEFDAVLDVAADPANHGIAFGLAEPKYLEQLAGGLRFTPVGTGSRLEVDLRATLVRSRSPRLERMASRKIETALTRDLVRYIERRRR